MNPFDAAAVLIVLVAIFSAIIQGGTVGMAGRYFVGRKAREAEPTPGH
ncbi:MAG: hypothetical protein MI806_12310 [Minwuiales bacterium]|nr:hypothetical protein [Minwuiales bacterium]